MRDPRFVLALLVNLSLLGGCAEELLGDGPEEPPFYLPMPVPGVFDRQPEPSRVIYLNREGATLTAGRDDSRLNRSSIVENSDLDSFSVPPFRGSATRWDQIAECIRGHFSRYDVQVVEQRPVEGAYLMVAFGGRAEELAAAAGQSRNILGLAPFNGQPVEDAVVLVFSRQTRERLRSTCETAAMEIAHAYGLDHTRACRDLMSYRRRCGRRRFTEEAARCGEHEDRDCGDGTPEQRSHGRLLEVLGGSRPTE